jgi:hypothetical protein
LREPNADGLSIRDEPALQRDIALNPRRLSKLLADCRSIKVKRLFLWFAERHHQPWLKHGDLSGSGRDESIAAAGRQPGFGRSGVSADRLYGFGHFIMQNSGIGGLSLISS